MSVAVLVTGGAGYVGSHACKALSKAGFLPVTYDNLERGHRSAVKWGPLEIGGLHDRQRLAEVFARYKPTGILHFAAYAYVGESMDKPVAYYWNNVAGSISLLEAALEAGVGKVVFSSTCSTFGVPASVPIDEEHPQRPINPYGTSKFMVERILADFDRAYSLRSVSLRYFNAAGADPDGEIGEAHEPETHLVPLLLQVASGSMPSITINGSDYPTVDGTCVRDYVHVSDLAEAHIAALHYLDQGKETCGLNLGIGKGWSVAEVIAIAREVTGRPIPAISGPRRPGDPPVLVANPERARRLLHWYPRYPHIRAQIEHSWHWYQDLKASGLA